MTEALKHKTRIHNKAGIERRGAILDAARKIFIADGYEGFTSRSTARNVGISLGNLQHFFPTKELLLNAMLEDTFPMYERKYTALFETMPNNPTQKFAAVLNYLLDDIYKPDTRKFFFTLWALSTRNSFAAKTMDKIYEWHLQNLQGFIHDIIPEYPPTKLRFKAIQIAALIEGLMIFTNEHIDNPQGYEELKTDTMKVIFELIGRNA